METLQVFLIKPDQSRFPDFTWGHVDSFAHELGALSRRDALLALPDEDEQLPDLWPIRNAPVVLVARDVMRSLEPYLSMAGSMASRGIGGNFLSLHVTNVVDALAPRPESSARRTSRLDRICATGNLLPLRFVARRLGEPTLFAVPEFSGTVFCLERSDARDSLLRRVSRYGLHGLVFYKAWAGQIV